MAEVHYSTSDSQVIKKMFGHDGGCYRPQSFEQGQRSSHLKDSFKKSVFKN